MSLVRVTGATPLDGFRVRLTLSDGRELVRDLEPLLSGPIFEPIRTNPQLFRGLRVDGGTLSWPNGADLCPDVLIWNGPPPPQRVAPAHLKRSARS